CELVSRVQGAIWPDSGVRLCSDLGLLGGDYRQQRGSLFGERFESNAFHRAVLTAQYPAGVSPKHYGIYGGKEVRTRRNWERRRQNGQCSCECCCPEVHSNHWRIVWRRKLWNVRQGLRPTTTLDVAEREDFCDGRRAGGERITSSESRPAQSSGQNHVYGRATGVYAADT